jgi:phenol/toluene 2-monooxygenase (NADH) P5/A5
MPQSPKTSPRSLVVRRLVLDLDRPLGFNPGQYVQLHLPGGGTRPYSLASAPADGRRIELHVKRSPRRDGDGWLDLQ